MENQKLYIREVWDILSRGRFISENSKDKFQRMLYLSLQENEQAYRSYFDKTGHILDHGRDYYQFCREGVCENTTGIQATIKKYLSLFDILIAWKGDIEPGCEDFTKKDFLEAVEGDPDLEKKVRDYAKRDSSRDVVTEILNTLRAEGFIERSNQRDQEYYYVTSAFNYLRDFYDGCIIYNEEETT